MSGLGRNVVVAKPKPLLRGWLHAGAAVVSVLFTGVLVVRTWDDPPRMISMLVFGLSMVLLYGVSAVYHIGDWPPRTHRVLRALDHANIFVLIAGTYTALCFNVLGGWVRPVILSGVWAVAGAGTLLAIFRPGLSRGLGTIFYISTGWVAVAALPALLEALPGLPLWLLAFGGLLYTLGALIYTLKRPNPFPRYFGFHEIFHLFVIAGSAVMAAVVWVWAIPYPRP
jgi:hemolysin III